MPTLDGLQIILDFLKNLPPKIGMQIAKKIFSLNEDPFPPDSKQLKGYENLYRIDSGEYRVVYSHDQSSDIIKIVLVLKRNDDEVYKRLKRSQR